jgi:hypothetical protein
MAVEPSDPAEVPPLKLRAGAHETAARYDAIKTSASKTGTAKPGTRTCIVVLGMHRSGTSALTRIVNILGAALPRHVMRAADNNQTGHWEPSKLVAFHDEVLAELDSAWHDWMPLDLTRLTARRHMEIKAKIAKIIGDEYGGGSPIVVKDPRICRFAPLFLEAVTDAGITPACVLIFRNPIEVVQSLARRDGMQPGHAGLLWLRHVIDSEQATRDRHRTVLFYGDLLKDWRDELRRAAVGGALCRGSIGVEFNDRAAAAIDGFLDPAQRHHTMSAADILADRFMSGWIADVHNALHQLRREPMSALALATFDRVRREFHIAAPVITEVQRDTTRWLSNLPKRELWSHLERLKRLRRDQPALEPCAAEQDRRRRLTARLSRVVKRVIRGLGAGWRKTARG